MDHQNLYHININNNNGRGVCPTGSPRLGKMDGRNLNLHQASGYHSPRQNRILQPTSIMDAGSMELLTETNRPPTDVLSPRKHHELYDSSGLAFADLNGSPSVFATRVQCAPSPLQSPVRCMDSPMLSPMNSPCRSPMHVAYPSPMKSPMPMSSPVKPNFVEQQTMPQLPVFQSPMKTGFTKIEHSAMPNLMVQQQNKPTGDWLQAPISQSVQPITAVVPNRLGKTIRFIPKPTDTIRALLQQKHERTIQNPRPIAPQQPAGVVCKSIPITVNNYTNVDSLPSQNEITVPDVPIEEWLKDIDVQPLLLDPSDPLLDENQNVCASDVPSKTEPIEPVNDVTDGRRKNRYSDVSDVVDGVVDVENDVVDVDTLIDDGDINITLSSWDDEDSRNGDEPKEYPCDICAKTFRRRSALSFHQCLHTPNDTTNQTAVTVAEDKDEVEPGLDTVDGPLLEQNVKNDEKKNFARPFKHLAPRKERSFLCEHCGSRFPSVKARSMHMESCDKAAQNIPVDMLKYIATAEDGRIMCAICHKIFNHRSTLKTHIRVHTGEKPCKCRFCGKYYRDHSTLSKHYRVHTNEKPYRCPECFRCFSQSGNMRRHIIHVHKINLPADLSSTEIARCTALSEITTVEEVDSS